MFSEARYAKGKAAEEKVRPYVTKYFNVYPTAERMDHFDYRSKDLVVEQKTRFRGDSSLYFWRFPCKKLFYLQNEGDRQFVLLYYWAEENRLFYITYNKYNVFNIRIGVLKSVFGVCFEQLKITSIIFCKIGKS